MNAVTPHRGAQGDQRGIAEPLARSEAKYLTSVEAVPGRENQVEIWRLTGPRAFDSPRERWSAAKAACLLGPTLEELDAYIATLMPAMNSEPEPKASRVMIAMLLAAYPSGRPLEFEAYADTLAHDVAAMRFTPHVVALACQRVRRGAKFLPSVAEFIMACEEAKKDIASAHWLATNMRERLSGAHALAAQPEPPPARWEIDASKPEFSPPARASA